jgi:tetratricopeptide (TPR) repeat protein
MDNDRQDRVDQLLREANVLRMRGQFAEAETRTRRALEESPDDLGALEMLAELLHDKGSLEEALALCHRQLEIQPGRASAETRLAKITLEQAERAQQRLMAENLLAGGGESVKGRKRRVSISLILSLFFPGLGQLYNGEYVKAAILGGIFLLGLWLGGSELLQIGLVFAGARGPAGGDSGVWPLFGFLSLVAWGYAVIDAPVRAARLSEEERAVV